MSDISAAKIGKNFEVNRPARRTVALFPWGDLIEDYLNGIGVSIEEFCNQMTGGWLFGYIDALKLLGIKTVIFCISARVRKPRYLNHIPTGARICILPASRSYLGIRRFMINPYAWSVEEKFGKMKSHSRLVCSLISDIAPYLSTPAWPLIQEMRRMKCNLILCQEYEYPRFDVCVMLGKLLRIPTFATFQGGNWQLSRLERFVRRFTLDASDGLIISSNTETQRVCSRYKSISTKISKIFNPINLQEWEPLDRGKSREKLGIPQSTRVAIWHGRVDVYRKGLDILVNAWRKLCRNHDAAKRLLILVGSGNDSDELRQLINGANLQDLLWVDRYVLDRTTILSYLSAADVYIFPSRHEGFPVAPIEAMACGIPVVAAAASGIPDIFENGEADGGLVVPREDPDALAASLGRILDNPDWGRMLGARARQRALACFSLNSIARQLQDFLGVHPVHGNGLNF